MKKRGQITLFIIFGMVIIAALSVASIFFIQSSEAQLESEQLRLISMESSQKHGCLDEIYRIRCNDDEELSCEKKPLDRCPECSCAPKTQAGSEDNEQPVKLFIQARPDNFMIIFVPINYDPWDDEFLQRVALYKNDIISSTNIEDGNILLVEKTLKIDSMQCQLATRKISAFTEIWFQSYYGESLPGIKYNGKVPIYEYRIIGIDKNQHNLDDCGCGYSHVYQPPIYIGGTPCSKVAHVAMHELGHTFGLCDEYNPHIWEFSDKKVFQEVYQSHCANTIPTIENSDCDITECEKDGNACCLGKYADSYEDFAFNVMGSADTPPLRRFSTETRQIINQFICDNFNICEVDII